jgi:hypothetical protein
MEDLGHLSSAYFAQKEPPSLLRFLASNLVDREARRRSFGLARAVEVERERARVEKFAFIRDSMPGVPWATSRWEVLETALQQVTLDGLYAEFGVAHGTSLRFICERVPGPVYGFDSFRGLPENWSVQGWRGSFARLRGAPPALPANATVVPGYFHESLPGFVKSIGDRSMAFLHMDADLYSSTSTVLSTLRDHIVPSTILVFDEYFGYPGWARDGEFRAFAEFVQTSGHRFEYLACNPAGSQVAVRILPKAGSPDLPTTATP